LEVLESLWEYNLQARVYLTIYWTFQEHANLEVHRCFLLLLGNIIEILKNKELYNATTQTEATWTKCQDRFLWISKVLNTSWTSENELVKENL